MLPARVPRPHDDTTTRAHLRANVQAAATGERHPGDWRLHYFATHDCPKDFTPVKAPDYIEADFTPWGQLLEHLAEFFGGVDLAQITAQHGLEAGG
jgi:hypothetical protein